MHITVNRIKSNDDATISTVTVDGDLLCFGLEDEYRDEKVAGETRIPAGSYKVGLRTAGSISPRYERKYPEMHEGMLHILDVPGFTYIYIHIGNTDEHTEGCLLIGNGVNINDEYRISNSEPAYRKLYAHVIQAALDGNLTIEFIDSDRK